MTCSIIKNLISVVWAKNTSIFFAAVQTALSSVTSKCQHAFFGNRQCEALRLVGFLGLQKMKQKKEEKKKRFQNCAVPNQGCSHSDRDT